MKKQTIEVTGMTCAGCESKVQRALQTVQGIQKVLDVSKDANKATFEAEDEFDYTLAEQAIIALGDKYHVSQVKDDVPLQPNQEKEEKSWWSTYKPVLMIFFYILGATLLIQWGSGKFDTMQWMRHFMAGFFLTFSFFKMLNLKGFKESYQMYDVLARRFPVWGYLYAFIELALGIAFLINFNPVITASVTLIVMSVSILGVLQTVLNKKSIQCACLGNVFNLPMSTVTIIEDGLMIVMSAFMLYSALV